MEKREIFFYEIAMLFVLRYWRNNDVYKKRYKEWMYISLYDGKREKEN